MTSNSLFRTERSLLGEYTTVDTLDCERRAPIVNKHPVQIFVHRTARKGSGGYGATGAVGER
jgi:hypothetical protein